MTMQLGSQMEWLEADGLGGFASGTANGIRTRRYHALLLAATTPPTGRIVLVNGLDAWLTTPAGTQALTSQLFTPDVVAPDGASRLQSFQAEPWPTWQWALDDGTVIEHELFVPPETGVTVLSWKLVPPKGRQPRKKPEATLTIRPYLSGRDYHGLHKENVTFRFDPDVSDQRVTWRPYPLLPGIIALHNGNYRHEPQWYRNFLYEEEKARGLDHIEDLGSPGTLQFDLAAGPAVCILAAEHLHHADLKDPVALAKKLRTAEQKRRQAFPSRLQKSADAYIVRRGEGRTIVAGYPWFTDWGRDTFIAIRGLCLATGRLDVARDILLAWADAVSEGMVPNRFPDQGAALEYNSVDASLWFVIAVHELLEAAAGSRTVNKAQARKLEDAAEAILHGYMQGTRYQIRMDDDGLLAAGVPNVALTWMDVPVDGQVLSSRVGKPVEVQALWLNALASRKQVSKERQKLFTRGLDSFRTRFWNEAAGCLFDVVDCGHQKGQVDAAFRPNQILAVGGLPLPLLEAKQARQVVDAVEARLLTPLGLRSLAADEPGYAARYEGNARERDAKYHHGTVWPWLLGPFVEAWVRVRKNTATAKREARTRFLEPLCKHLDEAGLGHVSEITDAEPPHTPHGCPFQAWSVGEALRLDLVVLKTRSKR